MTKVKNYKFEETVKNDIFFKYLGIEILWFWVFFLIFAFILHIAVQIFFLDVSYSRKMWKFVEKKGSPSGSLCFHSARFLFSFVREKNS